MKKKITSFFAMALLLAGAANAQIDALGYKIVSKGGEVMTADQIVPETQWYAVYQARGNGGFWWDKGAEVFYKSAGDNVIPEEITTIDAAQYVVRFLSTGTEGVYKVQFGTGTYMAQANHNSAVPSVDNINNAADIRCYNIVTDDGTVNEGHWGFNFVGNDIRIDNNGSGGTVAGWDSGTITTIGGNNDHKIYAISVVREMTQEEIDSYNLNAKTAEILADVEPKLESAKTLKDFELDGVPQITSVSQFSSPCTEPSEGSINALIDGDAGSFWHSAWSGGAVSGGTHYLQVELTQSLEAAAFTFTRRSDAANDHVTLWGVYGTNDSEAAKDACTLLATISTPFGSNNETLTSDAFRVGDYKYLRFYGEAMHPSTRGYFHMSEFQLYEAKNLGKTLAENMGDVYNRMEAAVAKAKAEGENITAETYAELESAYQTFCKMYVLPFFDGNYYLKNVQSGKYLGAGNSWGTQASLVEHGEHVTLAVLPDGTFSLESRVSNDLNDGDTKHFLGADGFMDNGSPVHLTFTAAGQYFTMHSGETYYGYNGTSAVLASNLTASASGALWQVIPEAKMQASLATATPEVPVDATFLIKDHSFSRNHRDKGAWGAGEGCNLAGGANENMCAESYHSVFDISQTLTVPNGVYAFTAQGFYRQDGTDNENLPVFYANDVTETFPLRTGTENNMSDASASFTKGAYTIDPIFVKVTDGTLKIGAKLEENAALWCIWDHFELKYHGETTIEYLQKIEYVKAYNAALAAAEAAIPGVLYDEYRAIIKQAIADNTLDTYAATSEELLAAIEALTTATNVAKEYAKVRYHADRAAELLAAGEYNFTEFLVNPNFEVNGTEGWTSEGTTIHAAGVVNSKNFALVTGSDCVEAWTDHGKKLADGKLFQQIVGLPAGKYVLAAEMQNLQQGDNSVVTEGFFLQLGANRTVVSSAASYTVEFEYNGVGVLEVAAVLEGCNGNWVCADNFRLFYLPELQDRTVEVSGVGEENIALRLNGETGAWEAVAYEVEPGTYTVQAVVDGKEVGEPVEVVVDVTRALYFKVDGYDPWLDVANLTVTLGDVATAINGVEAENGEQKAYTVSGQRAAKNYKGVVIVNGKLYIRK